MFTCVFRNHGIILTAAEKEVYKSKVPKVLKDELYNLVKVTHDSHADDLALFHIVVAADDDNDFLENADDASIHEDEEDA